MLAVHSDAVRNVVVNLGVAGFYACGPLRPNEGPRFGNEGLNGADDALTVYRRPE